jgi:hypothetical protein
MEAQPDEEEAAQDGRACQLTLYALGPAEEAAARGGVHPKALSLERTGLVPLGDGRVRALHASEGRAWVLLCGGGEGGGSDTLCTTELAAPTTVERCRLLEPTTGAEGAEEDDDGGGLYQAAIVERLLQEGAMATAAATGVAKPPSAQAAMTAFASHTLRQLASQRLLSRAALDAFLLQRCVHQPGGAAGDGGVEAALLALLPVGTSLAAQLAAWASVVGGYMRVWRATHPPVSLVLPRNTNWRGVLLLRRGLWSLLRTAQVSFLGDAESSLGDAKSSLG